MCETERYSAKVGDYPGVIVSSDSRALQSSFLAVKPVKGPKQKSVHLYGRGTIRWTFRVVFVFSIETFVVIYYKFEKGDSVRLVSR